MRSAGPTRRHQLQYGLTSHRAEQVKTLEIEDGRIELRAVTGPDYGRIYDHELVSAVRRIAGDGVGDIPCVVRTDGIAEEDSLAENVQRAPLHPLDQFRAFLALREKGSSEEAIAAAFFVSAAVVKQRLRLASVSPALLEVYAEDGMPRSTDGENEVRPASLPEPRRALDIAPRTKPSNYPSQFAERVAGRVKRQLGDAL